MPTRDEDSERTERDGDADDLSVPGPSQLWASGDAAVWAAVQRRYDDALRIAASTSKSKASLPELDRWYRSELPAALQAAATAASGQSPGASSEPTSGPHITRTQLEKLVEWKLARGQWRPRLLQYAREQPAGEVEAASAKALAALRGYSPPPAFTEGASARGGGGSGGAASGSSGGGGGGGGGRSKAAAAGPSDAALRSAVEALTSLKGVGPATASALLAAACPDVPYMGDEALAACLPAGRQSDYSLKAYLDVAARLQHKARQLSEHAYDKGSQAPATTESCGHRAGAAAASAGREDEVKVAEGADGAAAGGAGAPGLATGCGRGTRADGDAKVKARANWTAADVERCLWAAALLSQRHALLQGQPAGGGAAEGAGRGKAGEGGGKSAKRVRR